MTNRTLIARLHSALSARANCERTGNPYAETWTEQIDALLSSAPSGSGVDHGTQLLDWTGARVRFTTAFHHMAESGMYDGWTTHTVTVTPEFDGFAVAVSGRDRNEIKDYLGDLFHEWLSRRD